MTPIKHQVIQLLLPVLLETNHRQLAQPKTKNDIYLNMEELLRKYKPIINSAYLDSLMEILEVALGQPLPRTTTTEFVFPDNLSVVVLLENNDNHNYKLNTPYIVLHSRERYLLHTTGRAGDRAERREESIRLATDEEIEQCLSDLTVSQLKFILTEDLFAPILSPLYEEQDELVVEKTDEEKD